MKEFSVIILLGAGCVMLGCAQQSQIAPPSRTSQSQNMWATFSNMSETSFAVEAVAPPDVIREYVICKAVWFAERQKRRACR